MLIGVVMGAAISWFITWQYFCMGKKADKKSNKEIRALLGKIPEEILTILKEDGRISLTVKEMNELIESKTIDKNKTGVSAFMACPKCGSRNIKIMSDCIVDVDYKPDEGELMTHHPYDIVRCFDCNWVKSDLDGE